MFDIEDNIPVTGKTRLKTSPYPIKALKPGQSFFVPCEEGPKLDKLRKNINVQCWTFSRNTEMKFTVRRAEGGVRCWRIA